MLRPIRDFVVIARDEKETVSPGGIVVPDSAQQKVTRGRVLAVGRGTEKKVALADELEAAIAVATSSSPLFSELIEKSRQAVMALRHQAPELKAGDRVLFGKYTGNDVKVKDRDGVEHDCVVTQEGEIYGVIE